MHAVLRIAWMVAVLSPSAYSDERSEMSVPFLKFSLGDLMVDELRASVITPFGVTEPCEVIHGQDGYYRILYAPKMVGEYMVNVKNRGRHVPGSPFSVMVDEQHLSGAARDDTEGSTSDNKTPIPFIELDLGDYKFTELRASVVTPSGVTEPCEVIRGQDGNYRILYAPKMVGEYMVNVKNRGRHIPGSPFSVMVDEQKLATLAGAARKREDTSWLVQRMLTHLLELL